MDQIKKEFIPYEQAIELKQFGFNEDCFGYYIELRNPPEGILTIDKCENNIDGGVLAPTFSQAFRWFREKYNISYSIDWMTRSNDYYSGYIVHFRGINDYKLNRDNFIVLNDELPPQGYGVYKTYEEAELACLIKLIEMVKTIIK